MDVLTRMAGQVRRYVRRQLTNTLAVGRCSATELIQLSTMKIILNEQVCTLRSVNI